MDGEDVMEVKVYKERGEHWKMDRKKRKETEERTLREESEQYYFLYKLSLLRSTIVKLIPFGFGIQNFIFPCSCPRAKPSVVFLPSSYKFIDLG